MKIAKLLVNGYNRNLMKDFLDTGKLAEPAGIDIKLSLSLMLVKPRTSIFILINSGSVSGNFAMVIEPSTYSSSPFSFINIAHSDIHQTKFYTKLDLYNLINSYKTKKLRKLAICINSY